VSVRDELLARLHEVQSENLQEENQRHLGRDAPRKRPIGQDRAGSSNQINSEQSDTREEGGHHVQIAVIGKLPAPNQPALEANSTSGSAIAAAMTARAKQKPNRVKKRVNSVDSSVGRRFSPL
jgi:hypothetical protein